MARSSTTGVYTRVDNSFSNPVLGTVISPTDADSFFDDIDGAMNSYIATSTTSLAIQTGTRTFTVAAAASTKVFIANTQIHAFSLSNTANFMDCTVTSYNTGTGELVTNCFAIGGSGTITDWVIVSAGARGGSGPIAGFRQTYDSSTTDADPGNGDFRLNHATPASATAAYFDNVDTGGSSLTTILDALDDHGNSSARGILRAEKESDKDVWGQWLVTGSVVDGTGYRKVTLSGGSGSGSFTATDAFRWGFYPKGADGTIGGTTGTDDNRLLRADGTGGGTAQASAITVDDSGNMSGVGTFSSGTITTTGSIELGNASDTTLARSAAGIVTVEGTALKKAGKETIWVPASAMLSATTSGPAAAQYESSTNDRNIKVLDFDASADEHAHFNVSFPKSWDLGTVTFQVQWQSTATDTDGVAWALEGSAISDNESLDAAWGTAVVVTDDAQSAAGEEYTTSESAAVTIAGTPAVGDVCYFRIFRDVSDANDDMTEDARLIGVKLFFTTNAATDV